MSEFELVRLVRRLDTGDFILYFRDEDALDTLQRVLRGRVHPSPSRNNATTFCKGGPG